MSVQNEFFREQHPEQFSDSKIVKRGYLDRPFLEYHLSTISSRSMEKPFEIFCKRILEAEVCPNLITQTGPTGGGDSKVDTETFPVSEKLAQTWYYGFSNKASSERWAFAISSKKEWKSKCKSDIAKIVETQKNGRGYTKIFFISNQFIADKKRAETEDELRTQYGIDIRIFDRNWLLDQALKSIDNKRITCESLELSENLIDEQLTGSNDYKRKQTLAGIENKLSKISQYKPSEIVSAAHESIVIARELEVSKDTMLGLIDRYIRLTKEYGTRKDKADALYESAWTIHWWYTDLHKYYDYYVEFEKYAMEENSLYLFEKLITLWINLYALVLQENADVDTNKHVDNIKSLYHHLTCDPNRPNTILAAKTAFQMVRPFIGDQIDDIVTSYIEIVRESENSLEVDISNIYRVVTELPIYQEARNYDELFDCLLERLSNEKKRAQASEMLIMRGRQLIDDSPYQALEYYSRAVYGLFNEENKDLLMQAVYEMAFSFEKIGMIWAARSYYIFALAYSINRFINRGEITTDFYYSSNRLKWLELKLGRVVYSIEMHVLEGVAESLYPDAVGEDDQFDVLVSLFIFKSSFEKIHELVRLPRYLEDRGLPLSAIACRYELGYYDEELLNSCNGDKDQYDQYVREWVDQPSMDKINENPWYGFESLSTLKTRIMGCSISVKSPREPYYVEFASSVLASIECFLGTGFSKGLISIASTFDITIEAGEKENFFIDIDYSHREPDKMTVILSRISEKEDYGKAQKIYAEKITQIISIVTAVMLRYNEDFEKLKQLIEDEQVFTRTLLFAGSLFNWFSTIGEETCSFDYLMQEYEPEPLVAITKRTTHINKQTVDADVPGNKRIEFDRNEEWPDFSNTGNDKIITDGVINNALWDVSNWKGVAYYTMPALPPILALVFENESGLQIFDRWIAQIGDEDKEDIIGIRIIKDVNGSNPYWYRIGIGRNMLQNDELKEEGVFVSLTRLHTMEAKNDSNVKMFEEVLKHHNCYYICPAIAINGKLANLKTYFDKKIKKDVSSIKVIHAYEVDEQDFLAESSITMGDTPILPEHTDLYDIERIIMRKNKESNR